MDDIVNVDSCFFPLRMLAVVAATIAHGHVSAVCIGDDRCCMRPLKTDITLIQLSPRARVRTCWKAVLADAFSTKASITFQTEPVA